MNRTFLPRRVVKPGFRCGGTFKKHRMAKIWRQIFALEEKSERAMALKQMFNPFRRDVISTRTKWVLLITVV